MHNIFSPSQLGNILNCNGFLGATIDPNKQTPSLPARIGTFLHEYMEVILREEGIVGCVKSDKQNFNASFRAKPDLDAKISELPIDYTYRYQERITIILETLKEFFIQEFKSTCELLVYLETHLPVSRKVPIWSGTLDMLIYNPTTKTCHILDLKTGSIAVDPANNIQLMSYALGVVNTQKYDIDKIQGIVLQAPLTGNTILKKAEYTKESLYELENTVEELYKSILDKKPFTYAVGNWCEYCPFSSQCSALKKKIKDIIHLDLTENQMTDEEGAELFVQYKKPLKKYLEASQLHYQEILEEKGKDFLPKNLGVKTRQNGYTWSPNALEKIKKLAQSEFKYKNLLIESLRKLPEARTVLNDYELKDLVVPRKAVNTFYLKTENEIKSDNKLSVSQSELDRRELQELEDLFNS